MNSSLSLLHPYPFEKLNKLFQDITPADLPLIPLSIGEPKHPAPEFVKQAIIDNFQHIKNILMYFFMYSFKNIKTNAHKNL